MGFHTNKDENLTQKRQARQVFGFYFASLRLCVKQSCISREFIINRRFTSGRMKIFTTKDTKDTKGFLCELCDLCGYFQRRNR